MFLIIVTVISIIVAMLRKGSFANILDNGIKAWYLFTASVLMFLLLRIGDTLGIAFVQSYAKFLLLAAYALLLVGTAFNLSNLWMYPLLVGAVLNFIVIFINGGKMPLSAAAVKIAGLSATAVEASAMTSVANTSTSLTFLSGIIPIPLPSVLADVISPGTLLIGVGLFFIIQNVLLGIVYEYDDEDDYYDADDYDDYEERVYDNEADELDEIAEDGEKSVASEATAPLATADAAQNIEESDYSEDRDYTDDVFSFEEFEQSESLPEIDTLLAAGDDIGQVEDFAFDVDEASEEETEHQAEDDSGEYYASEEHSAEPVAVAEAEEAYAENTEEPIPSVIEAGEDTESDFSEEDLSSLSDLEDDLTMKTRSLLFPLGIMPKMRLSMTKRLKLKRELKRKSRKRRLRNPMILLLRI